MAVEAEAPASGADVSSLFDQLQNEMPADPRNAGRPTVAVAPTTEEPAKSPGEAEVQKEAEKPKEEAKPEVTTESPETQEPSDPEAVPTGEKAGSRWMQLKKENKEYKEKSSKLEARLKEIETSAETLKQREAELKSLQDQLESVNGELYIHRVEATPEWKKGVVEPLDDVFNQVDTIAKTNSVDPNALFEAVHKYSKGDKTALKGMLESMDEFDRADLHSLSKNLVNIQKRSEELKSNSKQALEASIRNQEELTKRQQEELVQKFDKAVTEVGSAFKTTMSSLLPEETAIDYARIGLDSKKLDTWNPNLKVYAAHAAVVMPELVKYASSLKKQNAEQASELAKFRNGGPKANTVGTAPAAPQDAKKPASLEELANTSFESFAGSILQGV